MATKDYFLNPVFCLLMALFCTPCLGQKKYEREYSIKAEEVPEKATRFVTSLFGDSKVNWYVEESFTGRSIEAKLRYEGERYSVEFSESGEIQDIEILFKMRKIDANVRNTIKKNLNDLFRRYRITKTQRQWIGSEAALKQAVLKEKPPAEITTKYELVLRGRKDKKGGYFEVLCDSNGAIESVKEIVLGNVDNLIY